MLQQLAFDAQEKHGYPSFFMQNLNLKTNRCGRPVNHACVRVRVVWGGARKCSHNWLLTGKKSIGTAVLYVEPEFKVKSVQATRNYGLVLKTCIVGWSR